MGKPTDRKKKAHLDEAEAETRRKLVNKQERDRQLTISHAFNDLSEVLPNACNQKSKLGILREARQYIAQLEKAVSRNNATSTTSCTNCQQQMGLQPKVEMPNKSEDPLGDILDFLMGPDTQPIPNTAAPQSSVSTGVVDQSQLYQASSSGCQTWSNNPQAGHSMQMRQPASDQGMHALFASFDNQVYLPGFHTPVQPMMPHAQQSTSRSASQNFNIQTSNSTMPRPSSHNYSYLMPKPNIAGPDNHNLDFHSPKSTISGPSHQIFNYQSPKSTITGPSHQNFNFQTPKSTITIPSNQNFNYQSPKPTIVGPSNQNFNFQIVNMSTIDPTYPGSMDRLNVLPQTPQNVPQQWPKFSTI